jgi:hypothetical protein
LILIRKYSMERAAMIRTTPIAEAILTDLSGDEIIR